MTEKREKRSIYLQQATDYEFRKDEEDNLLITYYQEGDKQAKALCIAGFKEGDYGLWIDEQAPYLIDNGKVVRTATAEQAGINAVLALEENKFLEDEERLQNGFLWIHAGEEIVFPQDKEQSSDSSAENNQAASQAGGENSSAGAKQSSATKENSSGSAGGGGQLYVCSGAQLSCSFGDAPSNLKVLASHNSKVCGNLIANIMDYKGMSNILPFGKCHTTNNPDVAAATRANDGRLDPQPCIPNIPAPWTKPKSDVKVGKQPALLANSKLTCAYSGKIIIEDPGQSILKE
ncbi:MAG: DUF4280 domain-containing protein [Bacillota bacterium]